MATARPKANRPAHAGRRRLHCAKRVEDNLETLIKPSLELVDSLCEFRVLAVQAPQTCERTHDFDVHRDRTRAAQNTRKHGNTLLGESTGRRPATTTTAGV